MHSCRQAFLLRRGLSLFGVGAAWTYRTRWGALHPDVLQARSRGELLGRYTDLIRIWSRPPAGYPPWYGPPWPWPRDTRSQHEAVQDYFPSIFLFYPHSS